ncbi:MAG: hypothetical protein LBP51_05930 [Deferribacteraceae bacterium]|jgi:hypothetical protein|nr:hypothetical protein [Deferribacteraceae bacterium]
MNKEKLLENGIVPQYLLAVGLLAVASLLVVLALVLGKVNDAMSAKLAELKRQETRYDYLALQMNAERLRDAAVRLSIEKFDLDTASVRLLNFSDYLNQRYKASMIEGIIKQNYELQVKMRFSYTPTSVEDFVFMLDDLISKEAPSTFISSLVVRPVGGTDSSGNYFVETNLVVSHPYYNEGGADR